MNEKLEKLNRQLAQGEARLRRAQHEEKILAHQIKQLRNRCRTACAGNRGAKALWPHAGRSRGAVLRILCRPKDTGSCDYTSQKVERGTGSAREE